MCERIKDKFCSWCKNMQSFDRFTFYVKYVVDVFDLITYPNIVL